MVRKVFYSEVQLIENYARPTNLTNDQQTNQPTDAHEGS